MTKQHAQERLGNNLESDDNRTVIFLCLALCIIVLVALSLVGLNTVLYMLRGWRNP